MLADLKDGSIDGYCIGEPWNLRASREAALAAYSGPKTKPPHER